MTQTVLTSGAPKSATPKARSNFRYNFYYKVKSNFKIMMVILILHLVSAPLNIINLMVYINQNNKYMLAAQSAAGGTISIAPQYNPAYPIIGIVATIIAVIIGILIVTENFNYLFKKSNVDMVLSLPLTTDQRFFSDYLAGLFTYLAPFVVSCLVAFGIHGIAGITIEGWDGVMAFNMTSGISTTALLAQACIGGFFIMLMVFALTALVVSCCGTFFESSFYTILANILIPGTIAATGYLLFGQLYGIEPNTNTLPFIEMTSPVGGVSGLVRSIFSVDFDGNYLKTSYLGWLIPFVLVTFLFFAATFFLYKHRKAEQVSKPFVYRGLYYVIITAITFCFGIIFQQMGNDSILPFIITTAIIYLLFEVVTNRGFKKFWISGIRYVATIAIILGFSAIMKQTDGFGTVYTIPNAESVMSVDISYNGVFAQTHSDPTTRNYADQKTIAAVMAAHKANLERYRGEKTTNSQTNLQYMNTSVSSSNIAVSSNNQQTYIMTLKYNLKNGRIIERIYDFSFAEYNMLMAIDLTNEYIDGFTGKVKNNFYGHTGGGRMKVLSLSNPIDGSSTAFLSQTSTSQQINSFFAALNTDMKEIAKTPAEYYTPTKPCLGVITGAELYIAINENYVNTLKFFRDKNITLPKNIGFGTDLQGAAVTLYEPQEQGIDANGKPYYLSTIIDGWRLGSRMAEGSEDLQTLLLVAQPSYYSAEPCYTIMYNGAQLSIPLEYNDLAKKLFASGVPYDPTVGKDGKSGRIQTPDGTGYYFEDTAEFDEIIAKIIEPYNVYYDEDTTTLQADIYYPVGEENMSVGFLGAGMPTANLLD